MAFEYGLEEFLGSKEKGKVGLVTNNTGRDRHGVHLASRIAHHERLRLESIFTPEHGFGSDAPDGEHVASSVHPDLEVPIISLYGQRKSPSFEELKRLDLLVYDIQDVGTRFYTYISTLRNVIEAGFEAGIPVHILDRPDILGGNQVEGPSLGEGFSSFVGHLPVPLRYGMTCGELGLWWTTKMEKSGLLKIWKCRDWKRGAAFEDLGVPWVNLSPSMLSTDTAKFYPGTCLFEGTNVSEGRGTEAPFRIIGAPWIETQIWIDALRPRLPETVSCTSAIFKPTFSKFQGENCLGIKLETKKPVIENSVEIGLLALSTLMETHPGKIEFTSRPTLGHPFFDYLSGNSWLREGLINKAPVKELIDRAATENTPVMAELERVLL